LKLSQIVVQILDTLRFGAPTYTIRLRLIAKRVVDFPFVLIELLSLAVRAEVKVK